MIESFKCKETKRIWHGRRSSSFPGNIQNKALRKLRQLDAANTLADLQNPPGNKLQSLKGDRKGQYSIRIEKLTVSGESVLFGIKEMLVM